MSDLETHDTESLRAVWPKSGYNEWINDTGEPNLVSVIIPTYNRAGLIVETLDSVKEQQYRPIEIIVIDDGSEDNTGTVVKDWAELLNDDKLTVAYHRQKNQGVASARNRGIKESQGTYIQLLDSDDKLHPKKISSQVQLLKSHVQTEYTYCLTDYFGGEGSLQKVGYDLSDHGLQRALVENPYQTSAALYARGLVSRAGPFGRDLAPVDDWEFAIRAYLAADGSVMFQDEAYNHQRNSSHDRLTGRERHFNEARLEAMIENKKVLEKLGILDRKKISKKLGINFVRMSFTLSDSESNDEKIREALDYAIDILDGKEKILPIILISLNGYKSLFEVAKRTVRGTKNIKDKVWFA